ncbi:MAG: M20/M25/M40 family metallo-hydrolase [Flavobacteriaceae bacterium]
MKKFTPLLSILIILATIYFSFSDLIPTYNKDKKTTSETEFSIDRALFHLKNISKKTHYVGSSEHTIVRDYIFKELEKLNLSPEIQDQVVINNKWRAATNTSNIIATIKGSGNGKALLLLTHYDSSPHSSLGASDAGSGVVTILEGVRAFLAKNKQPKNDIIILFSDAEELGLLGAKAFVENHSLAKNVGLVLNFEARGSGGPSYMLMETNGKNSKLLSEFLKANPNYPAANSLMYSIYKMLPNDTDLTVFRENGNINGFNFAFIGDHFDYHTAQDSYERLDRETLLHQADYLTTTLNYFSDSDLNNLNSNKDFVYVNFPFIGLLTFPFSWIFPLFLIALSIFLVLIFFGIKKQKLTVHGILRGFIPLLSSLFIVGGATFGLWKLILIIHPKYQDILHGFTYNGYQYILAFTFISLWIIFKIYNRFFKQVSQTDLFIAPITLWFLINIFILNYLQGAGFYIIPVFIALIILAILIFMNIQDKSKPILFTILSIPTIYIFSPFIKMFPVGLGLKMLFISGTFIVFVFGLMTPIFHTQKKKNNLQYYFGFLAILVFGLATYNSGFDLNKKKPNSMVFVQNIDKNTSYWATYNKVLDDYTNQFLGDNPTKGSITSTLKSKYNTRFAYHKETENKPLKSSLTTINKDTVIDNHREVSFTITPQRKINKIELLANTKLSFSTLKVNGASANIDDKLIIKNNTILIYHFANNDSDITVEFSIPENENPNISVVESSYDLLTNTLFSITPRTDEMMPTPFVTNDAIITIQKLKL